MVALDHGPADVVPTSAPKRANRHRSVAGRPAGKGEQTPPDLRRTRHPAQGDHHRGQHQRRHPDPRPGRRRPTRRRPPRPPRRRPEVLLGDKGYDSNPNRDELRKRRILPVISRKGSPNIKGRGKLRYVVEQAFALLHQFKRLAVRWERRTELHDAFASLACSLICWRRLKKTSHDRATSSEHGHR
ncbi:transposase [Streptomyces vinaceus]|nr:transposase [Streptomyces vinaceus]